MSELNYEQDVHIDEQALDVEWLRQPELMRRYTKHAAAIEKEMLEAKERLTVGKAQLEMSIRSNPEAYGMPKVTEGSIQSTILLQPEYQKLTQDFINAKYEYDIANGSVRAMDQRKVALENLVKLHGQQYFAGPSVPRDISKEFREHLKEKERKVANTNVKIQRRNK